MLHQNLVKMNLAIELLTELAVSATCAASLIFILLSTKGNVALNYPMN